ncbi:MAG: phosphoesterase [Eubacteriales bacterium]|nr:phosphoesterase [Eubacteriales bacterium]
MKLAVDLHIHSCLSPCGDNDMTPNNIAGMAALKGLDVIAVADHNSAGNVRSTIQAARQYDLLVLPALEANTREEIHVLCYFPAVEIAEEFGAWLHGLLPPVKNKPELFGDQLFMTDQDEVCGEEELLLINAADCSIEELFREVRARGGAAVPAHANKQANSILENLGFLPPALGITTVETRGEQRLDLLQGLQCLRSSDAHCLPDILEREFFIEVSEKSTAAILDKITQK